ncbi:hypothetical protein LRP88_11383 [Fusarium phalaenopsidis]|nr:hypothetical protein NCS56_01492700 [Fusarium sp. Ph1]
MHFSTVLYGFALLQGAMASPINEPVAEVEARDIEPRTPQLGDIPWPRMPTLKKKAGKGGKGGKDGKGGKGGKDGGDECTSTGGGDSNGQGNYCSSGTQYCCTTDANGVQTCDNSEVCNAKIICCNNNSGFQMCIGEIDFNAPVTININIYRKRDHKQIES